MPSTAIVWLRRDLRVHDHPPLVTALAAHDRVGIGAFDIAKHLEPARQDADDLLIARCIGSEHDRFGIQKLQKVSPLVQGGGHTTLRVTFRKPGKYYYLCTVGAHVQYGMFGNLTVTK